jgi:hypothetical protein
MPKGLLQSKQRQRVAGKRTTHDPKGQKVKPALAQTRAGITRGIMEFLTAEEVAKILRVSQWFVYQNRHLFGGIKLGKVVRFDREIFESKIKEVKENDSLSASREVEVRLLEKRSQAEGQRIQHQAGCKSSRSRSPKASQKDEFGLYKLMREQTDGS